MVRMILVPSCCGSIMDGAGAPGNDASGTLGIYSRGARSLPIKF
jgi:hypothetical protein